MRMIFSLFRRTAVLGLIFALALFPVSSFAEEAANTPAPGTQEAANTGPEAGTGVETTAGAGEAGTGIAGLSKAAIVGLAVGGAAVVGVTAAAISNNGGGGHSTTAHH